ncbi:hypothetical protein HXX76_014423 [Chlamydomonas incerta]|uniref:Peptidase S54 rhomboid domain-containing protein n=1 Tax=Chlamydomonas incerta TaxID=51695 RepID=A0A835VPM4_CHLIN|nr:hypothetical protein HXX76_014423 [Chlamydomonas incerta]|eukprot:KAG2424542.1 hypothetical protein HXX76_014423 [Chlamydomonas incerta]
MQQDARSKIAGLAAMQIAAQQQQAASRGFAGSVTAAPKPAASGSLSATADGTAAAMAEAAPARASAQGQGQTLDASMAAAAAPTASSSDEVTWRALRSELEVDWQRLRDRWRQFVARPLDPPPAPLQPQNGQQQGGPATRDGGAQPLEVVVPQVVGPDGSALPSSSSSAYAGAAGTAAQAGGAQPGRSGELEGGVGEEEYEELVVRRRATRLLQLACVAVFVAQWAPVVQALAGGGVAPPPLKDGLLALLLACPPTPVTVSMQMDVFSVSTGQWAGLLTSAMLHSGLLSLLVSLWSLDFTAAWLETAHGPAILAVSLIMAGGGAAAGQLLAGQPVGIGGIGAALGLEAAVAVRSLRLAGELPPLRAGGVALVGVAAAMAVYQPLVGPWALAGGVLGGALSGVLAYDVLWMLRVVVGVTILLCIMAWDVLTWLPRQLWRLLVAVAAFAWGTVVAAVQAVRGV